MNQVRDDRVTALVTLLCLGCGDPLKEAQLIEEPRVLGVRLDGENGSSQVAPGEQMEVTLLLAGPEGPVDAEVAFRVCVGKGTERGVPECSEAPFLEGSAPVSAFPISAELPEEVALGARILVLGVACVGSVPSLAAEPLDWGCSDDDPPLRFSLDSTVASQSEQNENPDLSEVTVELSGAALPLEDVDTAPSCEQDVESVAANQIHEVRVELGPGAAEAGEQLQASLFSTSGHWERQFSFLDPGQTSFSMEFEAAAREKASKQYLVIRDSRGGVSWVSWSFCQR